MKILKRPDTQWSLKHTCTNCTAELEIEKQDVKHTHYAGDFRESSSDSWTTNCPICGQSIYISENNIPKAVQVEIKNKPSASSGTGGWYDR